MSTSFSPSAAGAAHTPGPWEFVPKLTASENHKGFFIRAQRATRDGKWALADVQPADQDGVIGTANARLIAAAPELLEALLRSLNWLSSYPGGGAMNCYDQAREAIDKATNG